MHMPGTIFHCGPDKESGMKIAAYINQNGEVASFDQKGCVRLYQQQDSHWNSIAEYAFDLGDNLTLPCVQTAVTTLAAQLGDCRVFLSGSLRGVPYAILQEAFGFCAWKSEGPLEAQLDFVAKKELERQKQQAEACDCTPPAGGCSSGGGCHGTAMSAIATSASLIPLRLASGHYRVNLIDALRDNPGTSSRQLLQPFVKNTPFRKLELICDHLPRWLQPLLEEMDLDLTIDPSTSPSVLALISARH
jgi:Fe-only nitrogenase accessory protein AnfO